MLIYKKKAFCYKDKRRHLHPFFPIMAMNSLAREFSRRPECFDGTKHFRLAIALCVCVYKSLVIWVSASPSVHGHRGLAGVHKTVNYIK